MSTRAIHRFESIDSTMRRAADLARENWPGGTVVTADEQTAGQGRYGRSWHSVKGDGLYMSEILRLDLKADDLPVITLALGLAAADAITKVTDFRPDLRWPNDVMAGNKKCAGILVQLHDHAIIAGIGINVNQAEFPDDIRDLATSLYLATGRQQPREELLRTLIASIEEYAGILKTQGRPAILELFAHASSYVAGRHVAVDVGGGQTLTGTTEGLDAAGFLILREDNGKRTTIVAGGVRPA